jgi:hypothetical protein
MRNNLSIKRQIKENVFRLRADGLSYRQIAEKIGCSKGSINYHLSEGAAEKIKSRLGRIEWRKVWRFCYETKKNDNTQPYNETLLRKKGRAFLYGRKDKNTYRRNRMGLKHKTTKIFQCLDRIWPGIKREKEVHQAVNQWTGELDYYDDGTPIMTPYVRCKLTDEIINVKGSDVQIDHVNGDRTDNGIENFSAVKDWANAMKADAKSYDMLEKRLETVLKTIRKYK